MLKQCGITSILHPYIVKLNLLRSVKQHESSKKMKHFRALIKNFIQLILSHKQERFVDKWRKFQKIVIKFNNFLK